MLINEQHLCFWSSRGARGFFHERQLWGSRAQETPPSVTPRDAFVCYLSERETKDTPTLWLFVPRWAASLLDLRSLGSTGCIAEPVRVLANEEPVFMQTWMPTTTSGRARDMSTLLEGGQLRPCGTTRQGERSRWFTYGPTWRRRRGANVYRCAQRRTHTARQYTRLHSSHCNRLCPTHLS